MRPSSFHVPPFAHRFDTWILFSSHKMSSQHSDRISDARSAVAAQVSTSAKWSGEAKAFRIARVCPGVMTMGL